jgi:hypothetical protein
MVRIPEGSGHSSARIFCMRFTVSRQAGQPRLYLSGLAGRLVILDEVRRMPELFPVLRGLVDERSHGGESPVDDLIDRDTV